MVDNVKYLNKKETIVKVEPEGWAVPQPSSTWHQGKINQWLEGRTNAWDEQKKAYDNYIAIINYDNNLALYESLRLQCNENLECIAELIKPAVPHGYNTQEEVDNSIDAWGLWNELPVDERGNEPVVLFLPDDIQIVSAPAALIPNIIEPYVKPISEVRSEKLTELAAKFEAAANTDVVTAHGIFSGGSKGALERNGVADLIEYRGRPLGTIHDVAHNPIELNINQMKDVSADIAEAYGAAVIVHESKLKEIDNCGNDSICIAGVVW